MQHFAVIGHPVAHSLSPAMHAANFASLGIEATYGKFDVAPEGLAAFVRARRDEGYAGLNVTIPHKTAVVDLLDHVDESVRRYGSCNTLKFEEGGAISGYNTDVDGFLACLRSRGFVLGGARAAVVGCGGAGSALAAACAWEGAAEVLIVARRREKGEALAGSLHAAVGERTRFVVAAPFDTDLLRQADLIVNATPVGLKKGDASVVDPAVFRPGQFVLDIIPTRTTPPTAAAAAAAGAQAMGGLEFLVAQGARSFEIWTGLKADRAAMLAAVTEG